MGINLHFQARNSYFFTTNSRMLLYCVILLSVPNKSVNSVAFVFIQEIYLYVNNMLNHSKNFRIDSNHIVRVFVQKIKGNN